MNLPYIIRIMERGVGKWGACRVNIKLRNKISQSKKKLRCNLLERSKGFLVERILRKEMIVRCGKNCERDFIRSHLWLSF